MQNELLFFKAWEEILVDFHSSDPSTSLSHKFCKRRNGSFTSNTIPIKSYVFFFFKPGSTLHYIQYIIYIYIFVYIYRYIKLTLMTFNKKMTTQVLNIFELTSVDVIIGCSETGYTICNQHAQPCANGHLFFKMSVTQMAISQKHVPKAAYWQKEK